MSQLDCCPHCQSTTGYYIKTQIKGYCESRFTFSGEFHEEDNADMHQGITYKYGKWAYCRDCHKRLFKEEN